MNNDEYIEWHNRLRPDAILMAQGGFGFDWEDLVEEGIIAILEAKGLKTKGGQYLRAKSRMMNFCRDHGRWGEKWFHLPDEQDILEEENDLGQA